MIRRLAAALIFLAAASPAAADWQEIKGDHFLVYYSGDEKFARETARRAELYYGQIASDLGYPRYSNFWQWENRVKIYIYPTKLEFQKDSGQPDWSHGMADYFGKRILSYRQSEFFLDGLLPHELTHLIFRDFVGFKGEVPLWIDEGVAQWEEPKKRAVARDAAAYLFQNGLSLSLKELTAIQDLSGFTEEKVHHFYMQAVTLVDFLIRKHGANSFTAFCRQLRDGKDLNSALRSAYPGSIGSLTLLEAAWKKDIVENVKK